MLKHLLFGAVIAGTSAISFGQYNLQMNLISPAHNSTIVPQSPQPVSYHIRNLGPHVVPSGQVFHISWINNNTGDIFSMSNVENQSSGYQINSAFLDPDYFPLTANLDLSTASVGDVIVIRLWGAFTGSNLSISGDPNDTDMTNNYKYFKIGAADPGEDPGENPSVSITNVLPAEVVVAFPNPAYDQLEIVSGLPVKEVKLMDTNGAVVASFENQTILNIQDLSEGTYFYQVTTSDNSVVTKKFVKK